MAELDKKYNFVKRQQLSTRESPRKIKKLGELIRCNDLGLKPDQYQTIQEGMKNKTLKQIIQAQVFYFKE